MRAAASTAILRIGRQIDHEAALDERVAGDVVAAALDAEQQAVRAANVTALITSVWVAAADDRGRSALDHRVPDRARVVVAGGIREQDVGAERGSDRGALEVDGRAVEGTKGLGPRGQGSRGDSAHGVLSGYGCSGRAWSAGGRCQGIPDRL